MIYAIIILTLLLVIFGVLALRREYSFRISAKLQTNEIQSNVASLAVSLRGPSIDGIAPKTRGMLLKLRKSYKFICKKVEIKEDLFEYEHWIYENYFKIITSITATKYNYFALLPSIKGRARLLILADFIVSSNDNELSKEHVSEVISNFNLYTPLDKDEIFALSDAITYICIQRLTSICNNSREYYRAKKHAHLEKFKPREQHSDSYLYWRSRLGYLKDDYSKAKLYDGNLDNIEYSFTKTLVEHNRTVSKCIKSIIYVDDYFNLEYNLSLSYTNQLMSEDSIYSSMDVDSKVAYLNSVEKLSRQYNAEEQSIVKQAMELATETNMHFGYFLFEGRRQLKLYIKQGEISSFTQKSHKVAQTLFISTVFGINIVVSIMLSIFGARSLWSAITFAVALFCAMLPLVEYVVIKIFKLFLVKKPTPKLNNSVVGIESKTLVVMPCYVGNELDARNVSNAIIRIREGNTMQNVEFALLVDYPSSSLPKHADFDGITNSIVSKISKFGDINLLVRKSVKSGEKYIAYEKKRGALMDLVDGLMRDNYSSFEYILNKNSFVPKFVVTLDSDNELLPGSVLNCINTMLHPLNESYDLMTFNAKYNLYSMDTLFSKRYYYDSGYDRYSNEDSFYYNLSSKGVFNGKGIFRLYEFYTKLYNVLPSGRVLSHDILEGAILNTGVLNEQVYEDAPRSVLSEVMRKNRWLRGDLLLGGFLGNNIKNDNNSVTHVKKERIYGHLIASNILKSMSPISMLLLLLIPLIFQSAIMAIPFIIAFGLEYFIRVFNSLAGTVSGVRVRYVLRHIASTILEALINFIILPFVAINNLMVIVRLAFSCLFSPSKKLDWKPFAVTQQSSSTANYMILILPSIIFAVVMSGIFYSNIYVLAYFSIFIAVMMSLYVTGAKVGREQYIENKDKELLLEIASKTYKFFDECTVNDLITDNYQSKPYKGCAELTSPTNIGFSLLAEVSAYELGLISIEQANMKIASKLKAVNILRKYRGHLYNWYNIETKQILSPNVISSVDSGNFLASMITLQQFMVKKGLDNLGIVENLIKNTDLDFLYDKQSQQFHISYDTTERAYSGHYDMLASEARTLYYIYASISHNTAGWMTLKRQTCKLKGNTLMSWSGTMFEYLMPRIFMTSPQNSLLEDSEKNMVSISRNNKCHGIFGISESGYYNFDTNLKYQYHAFGLNEVSIRNANNACIISPYSTFLSLPIQANKAIENLNILRIEDMIGEYGYYEAVDFTSSKNIVYSYMSHHQGMIMTSIANTLRCNCISQYFESDSRMQGSRLLLGERRTLTKSHKIVKTDFVYNTSNKESLSSTEYDTLAIISNGAYSYMSSDSGKNVSMVNGNCIAKMRMNSSKSGLSNYVVNVDENTVNSFRKCDSNLPGSEYRHVFNGISCEFTNKSANITDLVYVPNCMKGEIHKFTISNTIDRCSEKSCRGHMDISISPHMDEISHTAFTDMFISSEKLDENTVVFHRKSRVNDNDDKYVGIKILGLSDVVLETNKRYCIDIKTKEWKWTGVENMDSFGDIVTPCYSYNGKLNIDTMNDKSYYIAIIYSDNRSELLTELALLDSDNSFEYLIESAKIKSLSITNNLFDTNNDYKMALRLGNLILEGKYNDKTLKKINSTEYNDLMNELQLPLECKLIYYNYHDNPSMLNALSRAVKFIKDIPTSHRIIVCYDSTIKNSNNILDRINEEFNTNIGNFIMVNDDKLAERIREVSLYCISTKEIPDKNSQSNPFTEEIESSEPTIKPEVQLRIKNGGFTKDGYMTEKHTIKPYSNVICGEYGGTVITTNGGGFTYFGNSRNNKVSEWSNNQFEDNSSEKLMIIIDDISWQINKLYENCSVEHKIGNTTYHTCNLGLSCDVNICMLNDGKSKLYEISLHNSDSSNIQFELAMDLKYALGVNYEHSAIMTELISESLKVTNAYTNQSVYQRFIGYSGGFRRCDYSVINFIDIVLLADQRLSVYFIMSADEHLIRDYNQGSIIKERNIMLSYFHNLNKINVTTDNKYFDILFNKSLMYQTVSARLNGKCGFYQVGGAIGFRDQLQDCLAYIYSNPEYVKNHIIESAKRQFIDGDVLHWWHNPNIGVRTRISDDKLFLPYVVSEYIRITGDRTILDSEASYLTGNNLEPGVHDMYMSFDKGEIVGTIYEHCLRAIDNSLKYGENDILLIGSGDWNDALNNIGDETKGESVWLSMFCYYVINRFSKYMDKDSRDRFSHDKSKLKRGIRNAYKSGWYARAFTKDGEWLGTLSTEVCNIDLICQSFAMISGACPEKMALNAMENAEQLIDKERGLVKLLSPPFDHKKNYGYISHYPKGVRENGGQYTHAVAWYIKALAMIDRIKAFDILEMINPINKAISNPEYDVEPYVMSADVYTSGVGGWTWYTGSSSWIYKVMLEDILGIEFDEELLIIKPKFIPKLGNVKINITKGDTIINITLTRCNENDYTEYDLVNTKSNIHEIILQKDRKIYDININYK